MKCTRGPKRTNQNTHHDRTTGNTQTYRSRHSRNIQRNGSDGKTEDDSEEDGTEVRLIQGLYGITQELLYMVDTRRVAQLPSGGRRTADGGHR